jgi:DNA-binding NtrC family response regulator
MTSRSPLVHELIDRAVELADADATVLLVGEPGTGKEILARALHTEGKRRHARFATITCADPPAAILDGALLAGEIPGVPQAAGARALAALSGGTLVLDHVESTPIDVQARMLRLLEDAPLPLGSASRVLSEVRLVAVSNVELTDLVESGEMRADFFHRVAVVPLFVPPLRERIEDLPLLAPQLLARSPLAAGRDVTGVADDALSMLADYAWPGNVRELAAVLERASLSARGGEIRGADLAAWWRRRPSLARAC